MSISDICLTLKEPEERGLTADHSVAQKIMCIEFDERIEKLKGLTLEQRIDLENFKAQVM